MASMAMKQLRSRARASGWAFVLAALLLAGGTVEAADDLRIEVLSNRADLISGGDALVEVLIPADVNPSDVRVSVNGADVTNVFGVRPGGRYVGLVDTLEPGLNDLRAHVTAAPTPRTPAHIVIDNHPIGGPVFSGTQLQPWICARRVATSVSVTVPGTTLAATATTRVSGLDADPVDDQCNAAPKFTFFYQPKSREGSACTFTITGANRCFEPYNPASPPAEADIADFTNDRGDTVKSIIVLELGTINRGIYQLVTFHDPTKPHQPWDPQKGWNGKLLWIFGASSSASRFQTAVSSNTVFNHNALSRGFMVASSSLTDHGVNANDTLGAETMMMVKEQIVETYGEIRYTIGAGCSGGSIMQNNIASAYPGLLQGIQPNCTYPDTLTTSMEVQECGLLQSRYFSTPNGQALTPAQQAAINGHATTNFCTAWVLAFLNGGNPTLAGNCGSGFPGALVYNATVRPDGVRCTVLDHDAPMLGKFVDTDGITKTNSPQDNEGLQYGLKALRDGVISAEEFVRLNEGVGSYTLDLVWNPPFRKRAQASAIETVYTAGIVTDGKQLGKVAIIDLRGNQSAGGDIHMNWRPFSVRERLDKANGHHDNQVIWGFTGGGAAQPGTALGLKAFLTLDQWLAGIEGDPSALPLEEKVRVHKPAGTVDMCLNSTGATQAQIDAATPFGVAPCPIVFQSSPRQVAGGPLSEDVFKCQLKPLDFGSADYNGATFTEEQQARLAAVFPDGVCDWTKPGVGQVASNGGTTFKNGPGGEPLGAEPASTLGPSILTALTTAKVWIGIKNSDDVGTFFDLKAEVFKDDGAEPIGWGQLNRTAPASSGFNNAKLNTIPLTLSTPPQELPSGTVLKIKLSARITCTGATHASGSARLWFNDLQAGSRFDTTIDGVKRDYYLWAGAALGSTQGEGPKTTIDVSLNSKEKCGPAPLARSLTPVGTWSITLP